MAGVDNRKALTEGLAKWVRNLGTDLNDKALATGFKVGEDAKRTIQTFVATTPSALSPGKPDRIWTGNMFDRVDYKIQQRGNRVVVKFGWPGLRTSEAYIIEQEEGSPRVATGMHSMMYAAVEAKTTLKNRGYKVDG